MATASMAYDYVLQSGHIGYGVRPSSRRRGPATWALGRMLDEARVLGPDRVLIVCDVDNLASARTIEHHGGAFEGVRDTEHGPVRRYWMKIWCRDRKRSAAWCDGWVSAAVDVPQVS